MAWGKKRGNMKGGKSKPSGKAGAIKQARPKPKTLGYVNVKKLALAVSKLGVNKQEKKRFHLYATDQLVSQLKVTGSNFVSGHYTADVSPNPLQGTSVNDIIGNKFRLMSSRFHLQFQQQSNVFGGPIKGTIYVIQPTGRSNDVPQIPNEFLNVNPYLGVQGLTIYDNLCNRNFDTMKNYKVWRKIPFKMDPDHSGSGAMVMVKTLNFGIKYNGGNGIPISCLAGIPLTDEFTMLIVLDSGNQSNTVASTIPTGLVTSGATTGLKFTYFVDHWFTDN